MIDNIIKQYAVEFRFAIEKAVSSGMFNEKTPFNRFPRACCGDSSDLLSQFLLDKGVVTYYVCGTYRDGTFEGTQTHAWLVTENNLIIDITGDQFKEKSNFLNYDKKVYVGNLDEFHQLFRVNERDVRKDSGIDSLGNMCRSRLWEYYNIISTFL